MKLSDTTISVLKNYSTINQNLMIKAGSNLSTMSAMKNIVASAEVSETFERDVAIYDLNEFLATLSLFNNPDLDFQDDYFFLECALELVEDFQKYGVNKFLALL